MNSPMLSEENQTRVEAALALIEQAQHLIETAAQQLCPVPGFATQWTQTHRVHDTVKKHWHTVNSRRISMTRRQSAA